MKLFIINKSRSIKSQIFLRQVAGKTLGEFMVNYAYDHRDKFHWILMHPGELYEHEGSVFRAVYTGIDTEKKPNELSISVGFRKNNRACKNKWVQYASRAEQTPALRDGTLADVQPERRGAWQRNVNAGKKNSGINDDVVDSGSTIIYYRR